MAEELGYVLPELKEGGHGPKCPPGCTRQHIWYISLYARDPITGRNKEKRYKVNRLKSLTARRAWARQCMADLTRKLQAGWNPFAKDEPSHPLMLLSEALDQWDRSKERQLRHSSPYSYSSMTTILRRWAMPRGLLDKYVHAFTRADAVAYMEYISEVRMVGNVTYNNHLQYMRMLFAWTVEKEYRTDDPFAKFAKRKEPKKSRTFLSNEQRLEMVDWIERNDPDMLLPVLWVYYVLIRPGELKRLHVSDVDLANQIVWLKADITKSGAERMPTIPDAMVPLLQAANFHTYPGKCWLITAKMVPGEDAIGRNTLNARWNKMRRALGWPAALQLYSLRDTGIIDLLRAGVDLLAVMQQAGHTDVGTTNKYLKHAFPHGHAEVKAKATPLRAVATIPLVK
jgi:integrase